MVTILGITAPIFILTAIGFLFCRSGLIGREQTAGMGRFVISFALPTLVIHALLERPLGKVIDWNYLIGYGLGSLLAFGLSYAFARLVREDSPSSFVGHPIVAMPVGAPAGSALALGMLIENLLMIPLTLAELGRQSASGAGKALRDTARNMIRHPILITITAGMLMALSGLHPPAIIIRVIDMLATATAPVALFVIGARLSGMKPGGMLMDVSQLTLGKLIVHPLLVLLCFTPVVGLRPGIGFCGRADGGGSNDKHLLPSSALIIGSKSAVPLELWARPCCLF